MTCEQAQKRLVFYVDGEDEEGEVRIHLRGCRMCRSARNEIAWGRVLIRRALVIASLQSSAELSEKGRL